MLSNEQKDDKVLELIKIDESYKNYFFRKAKDVKWFYKLKSEGHFNAENVPAPIQAESGGYHIPSWLPLKYLERLSKQIAEGKHDEIITEVIDIIREISETKVDNPHIWHDIINIISNLPNEQIPIEIFNHVPTWLDTKFRNSLPSSELCKKLIPKFLSDEPTTNDIQKAEYILKGAVRLKKKEDTGRKRISIESTYTTLIDLYWLQKVLIKENLIERIGKHCSNEIIFLLSDNLKKLLLDFPEGITISEKTYSITAFLEEENLVLKVNKEDNNKEKSIRINAFEKFSVEELTTEILDSLNKINLEFSESEEFEEAIEFNIARRLNSDYSSIWCNSIHKLDQESPSRDDVKMNMTLLLRNLLDAKAKFSSHDFRVVAEAILSNKYKLPLFRRLLLYVLSENWLEYKSIFWDMIGEEDKEKYFSTSFYDKELYYLLRDNFKLFEKSERQSLKKIIHIGPQVQKKDTNEYDEEYWKLKWFSALKDDPEFEDEYERLSQKFGITNEHYEKMGEVQVTAGSVSPFTVQEILDMDISELVDKILSFKEKDSWEGPSVDGFAQTLKQAVKEEPNHFAKEIDQFINIYYTFSYYLIRGFEEAWKENKSFDWGKVLDFCINYITSDSFEEDKLEFEGRHKSKELVLGVIGNLISEGTKNDDNAFGKEYLSKAKKILLKVIPDLEVNYDYKEKNLDYPTYTLNSLAGKLLRALIDYSLRQARIKQDENGTNEVKWETKIRSVFEKTLEKGIIDGFILQGMYFGQFNFLDKKWFTNKIKEYTQVSDERWVGFMGGYTFRNAYKNREIYNLMFPHYQRAIDGGFQFERYGRSGLVRHIGLYYVWDFEVIEEGTLISKFLNSSTADQISKLINFFREVSDQIIKNKDGRFSKKIVPLWKEVQIIYQDKEDEQSKKLVSNLANLTVFIEQIGEDNIDLLKSSARYVNYNFNSPFFLEQLNRLKDKGESNQTAKYIGELLKIMLKNSTPDYDTADVKTLVKYLYQNKEDEEVKKLADEICAEYTKRGHEFLRDLYNQNRT